MFKSTHRRVNYANVTATLALVFSMSGGALAANHYLITSTKQISPKLLKKLKGKTGATGVAGLQGKEGVPGKEGKEGKEGKGGAGGAAGKEGKEGPRGPIGPSDGFATADRSYSHTDTWTITKSLPAGQYVITADMVAYNTGPNPTEVDCFNSNGDTSPFSFLAAGTGTPMTDTWAQTLSTTTTVSFKCSRVGGGTGPDILGYASLTAVKVGNLG
jgi:hypothetical protein